jgi:hypothetical protein
LGSGGINIWDAFWTVAAAISGLGLPGAILLLFVGYFVVFLRWICRDSSFAEALRATKPGRRLWLKIIAATGVALFVLNLPLCSLELFRYGLYVASSVCLISIFSKNLREATRLSHWRFWLLAAVLSSVFDILLFAYCESKAEAAGLESFLPFMELVLVGLGWFLFFRVPETGQDSAESIALRLGLCVISLAVLEHSSVQTSYFLFFRSGNMKQASQIETENRYIPVYPAMHSMLDRSVPRASLGAAEDKVLKARPSFEQDLARVLAFFFGLAGFNAIFATVSRHFGIRNAKRIPPLVPVTLESLASVPEMPEPVRKSVFYPNRRYRKGHSAQLYFLAIVGNFLVSMITTFSASKGNFGQFALSFVAYSGMLYLPIRLGCRNGYRLAAYRARSSLHGVRILMHNHSYVPLDVMVRLPTTLQRIQHRITGAWVRHAVDKEGRQYSLMFGHCPNGEFPAQLYRLRSGPLNESLTGRQAYVAIPKGENMSGAPDLTLRAGT